MGSRQCVGFAAAVAAFVAATTADARSFLVLRAASSWIVIDRSAIEKAGEVRRGTIVTVQANILDGSPPQPGYVRSLNEYDCSRREVRWRTFSAYSRTGTLLIKQDNRSNDWAPASAAAETLSALRVVCGESEGDAAISAGGVADVVIALMQAYDPAPVAPVKTEPAVKPTTGKPAAKPR